MDEPTHHTTTYRNRKGSEMTEEFIESIRERIFLSWKNGLLPSSYCTGRIDWDLATEEFWTTYFTQEVIE